MFRVIASVLFALAGLGVVAAFPTADHEGRQSSGPTGFNMFVVCAAQRSEPLIHNSFSTSLVLNGSGCPPGSAVYTLSS
jgi:hypothetical protein